MCFCQTGIENNKHFHMHCPRHSSHRRDLLDRISNVVDVDPKNLSSTDLFNLLMVIHVSRLILTITSLKQQCFYEVNLVFQADLDKLSTTYNKSGYSFYHFMLLCIAFSFHISFRLLSREELLLLIPRAKETNDVMSFLYCS